MLTAIHPKLPMRNKAVTREFYCNQLGFEEFGSADFNGYLMVQKDQIQIHFFEFTTINPLENYGQVYIRTKDIETVYRNFLNNGVAIHPNGPLEIKPWGQKEFSILDPDHNLLTFGQSSDTF
ncbi:VOC family protein [Flavobacterium sp. 123]|jgi:catechol 2,3-dioxygenase-like lactoylglutathione lyase family enzyme|uniref:bleomycin resistance protein n=1 Tax=Flavobacterium sp. 123 TaxID=2135627 RepID=UPI000EB37CB3|nr:VOC family protein [Flavobacterium sp. 123]RKS99031.1 extradiol dioxygenase family protein [Flavobacterium sp. 123]